MIINFFVPYEQRVKTSKESKTSKKISKSISISYLDIFYAVYMGGKRWKISFSVQAWRTIVESIRWCCISTEKATTGAAEIRTTAACWPATQTKWSWRWTTGWACLVSSTPIWRPRPRRGSRITGWWIRSRRFNGSKSTSPCLAAIPTTWRWWVKELGPLVFIFSPSARRSCVVGDFFFRFSLPRHSFPNE